MNEPLARWLIPRVEFSWKGERWRVIFDHRSLLLCEELTGVEMLSTNLGNPSAKLLRALLSVGTGLPLTTAGEAITSRGLSYVRSVILAGWAASMPEPKPAAPKKKTGSRKPKPLTWPTAWAEATSRHGLGLTDEQWLGMTPRQVAALKDVWLEQMQREEMLVGILAAETVNHSMCRPKQPRTAASFMIHQFEKEPETDVPITGEYIMEQMARARRG